MSTNPLLAPLRPLMLVAAVLIVVGTSWAASAGNTPFEFQWEWRGKSMSHQNAIMVDVPVRIGTVEGKTFFTSNNTNGIRFLDALDFCSQNLLFPATITSSAQDELIGSASPPRPFWIPATSYGSPGTFKWIRNGQIATYTNWRDTDPVYGLGGFSLNCAYIYGTGNGTWTNLQCNLPTIVWRPLCEYP